MNLHWLAAAASALVLASSAQAQTSPAGEVLQANAEAAVEQPVAPAPMQQAQAQVQTPAAEQLTPSRPPLIDPILAELGKRSATPADNNERNWLSELTGYYASPDAAPLWIYRDGYLPRGWEAVTVLRNAWEYGLDETAFPVSEFATPEPSSSELAAAEVQISLDLARYAWYARGGRFDPSELSLWLSPHKPDPIYASELMRQLADSNNITAVMRTYQPQHPQFEQLRRAYLAERGTATPAASSTTIPPGPRLERGARHPDVAAIRKRLNVPAEAGDDETLLDRELMREVREFMADQGYGRKRVVDDEVRSALSKPARQGFGAKKALIDKYLANLERWRWVPANFGSLYVWNNLPEFETRVVKDGTVIHQERIVIGTPKTQTPVFSDSMSHVIFQPEWGVPESIKIRDLLPRLRGGDISVLTRRNMRIYADGKEIRPSRYNWSTVDVRSVPIVQRAGPSNPLGKLKFIFPNAHDVYMHDTPSKDLFNSKERTFSHGCIRVRNPQRLAEVLLGEIDGWTPADVKAQLTDPETRKVDLKQHIPVHNTYFTLVAGADRTVASLKDVYNYDRRVLDALNGKSLQQIAASDPALALKKENEQLKKAAAWRRPAPRGIFDDDGGYYDPAPKPFLFWFN